jgi:hypothetical protein
MSVAQRHQRDAIRDLLADLKMPGSLEAVDGILSEIDGGRDRGDRGDQPLLTRRSRCATTAGCRPRCAPRGCRR